MKEISYDSIIFDLDGTLWECIDATYISAQEIIKKHNLDIEITKDQIIKGMGKTSYENACLYMPSLSDEIRIPILKEIDNNRNRYIDSYAVVYKNVYSTLKRLSKKYKLFIVSNCGKKEYIEKFIELSNTKDFIIDYIAAGQLELTKSEAILMIIDKYDLSNSVYVGDTLKDKEAASGVNIEFIHAKYGFEHNLESKYKINDISDLN